MSCPEYHLPETDVDYLGLPEALRYGMRRWIEHHDLPGGFLTAVLENDLLNAACRADDVNLPQLKTIVQWLYHEAPSACWRTPANVTAWAAIGDTTTICSCGGHDGHHRDGCPEIA